MNRVLDGEKGTSKRAKTGTQPVENCATGVKSRRRDALDQSRDLLFTYFEWRYPDSISNESLRRETFPSQSFFLPAGEVEFLTKPFRDQDLLDAIHVALDRDRARRTRDNEMASLRQRFDSLPSREQEVVLRVAAGMLNRQIAAEHGTACESA